MSGLRRCRGSGEGDEARLVMRQTVRGMVLRSDGRSLGGAQTASDCSRKIIYISSFKRLNFSSSSLALKTLQ